MYIWTWAEPTFNGPSLYCPALYTNYTAGVNMCEGLTGATRLTRSDLKF